MPATDGADRRSLTCARSCAVRASSGCSRSGCCSVPRSASCSTTGAVNTCAFGPISNGAACALLHPASHRLSVVVPAFGEGERIARSRSSGFAPRSTRSTRTAASRSWWSTTARPMTRAIAPWRPAPIRCCATTAIGARAPRCARACSPRSGRTVTFTDADLAYSPDQIVGLLQEVEAGWDVVTGQSPSHRHHDARSRSSTARDRWPSDQRAHARSSARAVPRHPMRVEGLSCRRRSLDLRSHTHRRLRVRRGGVLPRRAVPPVVGRGAGTRGELVAIDGSRGSRRVATRARSLPHPRWAHHGATTSPVR